MGVKVGTKKNLYSCERTFKGNSSQDSKRGELRKSLSLPIEYLSNLEQSVSRNRSHSKHHSAEVSNGNREHVIGHWKKGYFP